MWARFVLISARGRNGNGLISSYSNKISVGDGYYEMGRTKLMVDILGLLGGRFAQNIFAQAHFF